MRTFERVRLHSIAMALSIGPDVARLIADTEAEIQRVITNTDPATAGLYEMCRYHLGLDGSGPSGKRIRPLLGLLAYASITGEYERALPGAAAVELGHNFSLVHDDIEDGDRERRHRPALWARYGIPQAINTGDILFSLSRVALHRLTELDFPDRTVLRLMRLYDNTCVALCEGQYLDIWMSEHDDALSVDLYFDMIGRKTAALIAGSIEAGAVLATEDEEVIARYRAFGWDLGIAFQLNDDLLGIWGREDATGKEPTDLARKKKTLPVIYAFEHADPAARARLASRYAAQSLDDAAVGDILTLLEAAGAREYTRDQAVLHRDRALAELAAAGVVDGAAQERLEAIVRSVISA